MKDLVLSLDTSPKEPEEQPKTSHSDDLLGGMLQGKWQQWSTTRREIEESWLQDLRAYDQINEPGAGEISKFHSHIYMGLSRTKANAAFARITDLISDEFWDIAPTPVPRSEMQKEGMTNFTEEMRNRAAAMKTEISDKLLDLGFDDHLKSAILEACIIGTGCIKGVLPSVKKTEKWSFTADDETGIAEWNIVKAEIPYPSMGSPSIFDVFVDPYATREEDMSGVFERHVLNRRQFTELKDDPRFDEAKIDEILEQSENGNHVALYHEIERRSMAKTQDTTASGSDRYDVLEYWGQVTGRMLSSAGVADVESSETYWANVWVCFGKTILARVSPLKKQKIPYNFFRYSCIPHQFWGVSPVKMLRHTQNMINGSMRAMLDSMVLSAYPLAEINSTMLMDGQDYRVLKPGQIFVRDSGDPSVPAVRFFQPNAPTGQLMQMVSMLQQWADNESSLPAYSYESNSNANTTSSGLSMQLGMAKQPIKAVLKNLEKCVSGVIHSMYDWEMEWSDLESIKGDMEIQVLGTSAIVAKEMKAQALLQFASTTQNPLDLQYVDRKYILRQIADALEIDSAKCIPDMMPENDKPEEQAPDPLTTAKAQLAQVQAKKEEAAIAKIVAETAQINVASQFSSTQAAAQILTNPALVQTADELLLSAGYVDQNGTPIAQPAGAPQVVDTGVPHNTHPNFPADVPQPEEARPTPPNNVPNEMKMPTADTGLHTARNEPLQSQ